jgi:hypothetical protein
MGGYGSGRPSFKQKAEHCRSLDVNRMHQTGVLKAGSKGSWVWSQDGKETGRIDYKTEAQRIVFEYRVRFNGGEWEQITLPVPIAYAACNYGGKRPYFLCPGVVDGKHCRRRVGKLFAGGKYFLCRHCYNVAYASQSEAQYDRKLRRANKLRIALGGEPGTAHWIAPRPKGMWERTYHRKVDEISTCESQADILFLRKFAIFLSSYELETYFGG